MSDLAERRVLVVGLARSGMSAAEALVGCGSSVVGFDRNEDVDVGRLPDLGVEVHSGREEERLLQGIDLVEVAELRECPARDVRAEDRGGHRHRCPK